MALGDAYATLEEYKQRVPKNTAGDDSEVARDLSAVSRYIDKATGRALGFQRDPSTSDPVARYYLPRGRGGPLPVGWAEAENPWKLSGASRYLEIDDHVSITEIAIDQSRTGSYSLVLTTNDYQLWPLNAAALPEPEPYRQILLTEWGTQWAWLPLARVRVTGYGGWPAVPAAIKSACIELTAILRVESNRATNRFTEANQVFGTSRVAQNIVGELVNAYGNAGSIL